MSHPLAPANHPAPAHMDLLYYRWPLRLPWGTPRAPIVACRSAGNVAQAVGRTVAFTFVGSTRFANVLRPGPRPCCTGPSFLPAAAAALLRAIGVLPLGAPGWNWIIGTAAAGAIVACCGAERWPGHSGATRPPATATHRM